MHIIGLILSILLCLFFPALAIWAYEQPRFPRWLSTIVACYGIGILVSNLRLWAVPEAEVRQLAEVSMLIGLPLLLFAIRLKDSLQYARKMLLAFGLCCLSGIICTCLTGWWLSGEVADAWKVAGMLTGLYTGGTPNVNAIGVALEAPPSYLVLVQAADVLLGGAYLLGLISFLPAVYSRFFPYEKEEQPDTPSPQATDTVPTAATTFSTSKLTSQFLIFGLGLLVTAVSLGICRAFTGDLKNGTLIILLITSLGLVAGGIPKIQKIGNPYPIGEYFILIFCVALGLLADFRQLAAEGMDLLYFSAIALAATTLLHLVLCYWWKIDRDTVILSSVAGFYGPVFVVQVATAIQNKRLMAAGLAVSLLGFGLGNYLGLAVAYTIRWLTG